MCVSSVGLAAGGFLNRPSAPGGLGDRAGGPVVGGKEVMHNSQIERRSTSSSAAADGPYADPSRVVRQGMAIQASLGTRSAVEFLKGHGVHGEVIHRVLTGEQVRSSDQLAPAQDPR
jgi:hypothetical protein